MIKIGKYYYKNFWAFIQVVVFRKPSIQMPKGWNKQIKPLNPTKDWTEDNFLYEDYRKNLEENKNVFM